MQYIKRMIGLKTMLFNGIWKYLRELINRHEYSKKKCNIYSRLLSNMSEFLSGTRRSGYPGSVYF